MDAFKIAQAGSIGTAIATQTPPPRVAQPEANDHQVTDSQVVPLHKKAALLRQANRYG
jgi:hypothetical protein